MDNLQKALDQVPYTPGVYMFRNKERSIIYIGKAVNLHRRVNQYFSNGKVHGEKIQLMVSEITGVEVHKTLSELDALLLEAKLINRFQPKYNSIARDDKSPLYILLALHEEFPIVLPIRKNKIHQRKIYEQDIYFGPFHSSGVVKMLLRNLRHITPFCIQKIRTGKPCFYTHFNLCNPCPSVIEKISDPVFRRKQTNKYRRNILLLRDILKGKSRKVITLYMKHIRQLSRNLEFEEAAQLQNQVNTLNSLLEKHFSPMIFIEDASQIEHGISDELQDLHHILNSYFPKLTKLTRIECYDVSNLFGQEATGSMVILTNGIIDASQYKRFKIKTVSGAHDTAMLSEIVSRRIAHDEWPMADCIVIDGGKGQVRAIQKLLADRNIYVPVIGLAKQFENIYMYVNNTWNSIHLQYNQPALQILQRIRDESHRFALSYHRHLRIEKFLRTTNIPD